MVQENCLNKVVVVCGPTASGKTELSVYLAKKFNGEVISADSVAIYKGLDIGSAKPTKKEMDGVAHYMIDVVSPEDSFSVSDYEKMALPILNDIINRSKLPIICGGTGFYINSLLYKFSYGQTAANTEIRNKYNELVKERGAEYVYDILKGIDKETAEKLHPNDTVRVIRALEIYESGGIKKSDIKDSKEKRYDFIALMPKISREKLYDKIERRVDEMIKNGLEDEVRSLLLSGITLENQCMQGIGYKEIANAILNSNEIPTSEIKLNSRHYAKRQITFFKKTENLILLGGDGQNIKAEGEKAVSDFLKK